MHTSAHRRTWMRRAFACAMAAATMTGWAQVTAAEWPTRPVKLVVASAAGGQTDLFARYIAEHLTRRFGQPFVVDNRPGASGTLGALAVTQAPADGHTFLFSAASFTVVPAALNPQLPYDPLRDLAPVIQIGAGGQFIAVAADFPARDLRQLLDKVRAEPGKLSYGTGGVGSTNHLNMAALLSQQGLDMVHIPYKAAPDVAKELAAGILQVGMVDTSSPLPLIRAGKIRVLAITGTTRVPANPEVPTLQELGYPIKQNGWLGLFAPAATPAAIVKLVNAEVGRLLQSPEARQRLEAMNVAQNPPNTPEQFADTLRADFQAWRKVVLDNRIQAQ